MLYCWLYSNISSLAVDSYNDASFRYLDPTGKVLKVFKEGKHEKKHLNYFQQMSLQSAQHIYLPLDIERFMLLRE